MSKINRNVMKEIIDGIIFAAVILLVTFLLVSFLFDSFESYRAMADTTKDYVIDDADILTDSEEEKLQELCEKASTKAQCDIVIITMNEGLDGSYMDSYIRSILESDYGYSGSGSGCDACAYSVDMTSRADRIVTSGIAKSGISQTDLNSIRYNSEEYLSDSAYYKAFAKYVNTISLTIQNGEYTEPLIDRLLDNLTTKLIISVVVAGLIIMIMLKNAKAATTTNEMTYAKDHQYKINARNDIFINTTVVKRRIETNHGGPRGGGHGGGHGGGNSGHSGGHF